MQPERRDHYSSHSSCIFEKGRRSKQPDEIPSEFISLQDSVGNAVGETMRVHCDKNYMSMLRTYGQPLTVSNRERRRAGQETTVRISFLMNGGFLRAGGGK